MGWCELNWSDLGQGQMEGSREHDNDRQYSIT
jgi:hypothetical protein